ncbi:MAG: long-chain fatty acid--CoA ligase [Bacteroidota bacterium]
MISHVFDLPKFINDKYSGGIVFSGKKAGEWLKYSAKDYTENADAISHALLKLGIQKNDAVVTLSNNRPEWNFTDIGIMQIGAVHVPVYPTISDKELTYILNEIDVKVVFVSNNFLFQKVNKIRYSLPSLKEIISYDNVDGALSYINFLDSGRSENSDLETHKSAIDPKDLATIIYTSGTTSKPKGVMLSHTNLVSNFMAAAPTLNMSPGFVSLSYLPLCHVYERMINYMHQYLGFPVYYAESLAGITSNFKEVRPNVVSTVPLLLEKIYAGILAKGNQLKGIKKSIFLLSVKKAENHEINMPRNLFSNMLHRFLDKKVYAIWREALGGNMQRFICGGAALQHKYLRFFWNAGIPVHEGYGLTETSPLLTVNHYSKVREDSVGQAIDGVELKIAADGEILCRTPGLMQGYFQKKSLTDEVINQEGWFHTGDTGMLDQEGFLFITGRKKDLFKTSAGVYISPDHVEGKLRLSPYISQAIVVGANKSFLSVLLVPDYENTLQYVKSNHEIEAVQLKELILNPEVIRLFQTEIDKYNQDILESEKIEKFVLMEGEWTIENNEITPSLKTRREFIIQKYKKQIEDFYV